MDEQELIPPGGLFRVASGRDHRLPCPESPLSVQREPCDRFFCKRRRFQLVARFAGLNLGAFAPLREIFCTWFAAIARSGPNTGESSGRQLSGGILPTLGRSRDSGPRAQARAQTVFPDNDLLRFRSCEYG